MGMTLAIFGLQVTLMLPTRFQVNLPFASGEEAKNRFSRWLSRGPSWISDGDNLTCFELQVTPMLPIKFQVNWPLVQEKK